MELMYYLGVCAVKRATVRSPTRATIKLPFAIPDVVAEREGRGVGVGMDILVR